MKTNKHTLDFLIRICLYTLPIWLLGLSALSLRNSDAVTTTTTKYHNKLILNMPDFYYDSGDSSYYQLVYNDSIFNSSSFEFEYWDDFLDDTLYVSYNNVSTSISSMSYILSSLNVDINLFYFDFYYTNYNDSYLALPIFEFTYDNNHYDFNYQFWGNPPEVSYSGDIGYYEIYLDDSDFDCSFYYDYFSSNSIFLYTNNQDLNNLYINYQDYVGSSGLPADYCYISLVSTPFEFISDTNLSYFNFNQEFNNVIGDCCNIPYLRDIYVWFNDNLLDSNIPLVLRNVWALVFYWIYCEFIILIKNILVFIFFVANRFIERGFNLGKD